MLEPTDTLEAYARRKCPTCGGSGRLNLETYQPKNWAESPGEPCPDCREYPDGPPTGYLLPMLSRECPGGSPIHTSAGDIHYDHTHCCQGTNRALALDAERCDAAAEKAGYPTSVSTRWDSKYITHDYALREDNLSGPPHSYQGSGPTRPEAQKAALVAVLVATWPEEE